MSKFVVVSNRLPINISRVDGNLVFETSSGGLATAMSSLNMENQLWVGWPGIPSDDLTTQEKSLIKKELAKRGFYPVHLTRQQIADFYEGYSNDTLWPLFHYFQSLAQYRAQYWKSYQQVNKLFARAIKSVAAPDATLWIQDYQLMLLPSLARTALPDAKIGFFLHIPFPSYEIFRQLPERQAIIEGLLGADLLGFHIYDYARHFLSSCDRLLGTTNEHGVLEYEGRMVKVDTFPIGIDYKKFRQTIDQVQTVDEIAKLSKRYGDQKIILSVDRLDYSKGILRRLEALDYLFTTYPEYIGKVTLIVVAVPSRTEVETYKKLRDELEQAVSRINGRYSSAHWSPISYQFKNLPFHEIVALYAKADVALVTPLRDGMNLVAKEYVASKKRRTGVLILSEMAGAADELIDALIVNPNNITKLGETMRAALTMPKTEQRRRLRNMQARLSDYSVQKWGSEFIDELDNARNRHMGARSKRLTPATTESIVSDYRDAKSRLVLLDYDGTLRHFTTNISADAAKPTPRVKKIIKRMLDKPDTHVYIISGRPKSILDKWFRTMPNLGLVAEHGAWIKRDGVWQQTATSYDKTPVLDVMRTYALRTAGAIVEEKEFACVWHYRKVNPELAYVRKANLLRELHDVTENTGLGVYNGRKIVEVKPIDVHKGAIVKKLADEHRSDMIFCAGDDYTDEDMFEALPNAAHTVKIGYSQTHARYQVGYIERVLGLLEAMSRE